MGPGRLRLRIAFGLLGTLLLVPSGGCGTDGELSGPASDGLVFVRATEGGNDLFRARLSDGAVERMFETPQRDEDWPKWSEAAGRLAFIASPGEGADERGWDLLLWSPGDDHEGELQVSGRSVFFLDWSPTLPRLAYSHRTKAGHSVVRLLDAANGSRSQIARAPQGIVARPSFAFEGRRVLAQWIDRNGASRLWLIEPGEQSRRLTGEKPFYDDHARFTRKDRFVVFDRRKTRSDPADLMLLQPEGGEVRPLTESPEVDDHSPRVSPVRDELVFVSDRTGRNDIFLMDYEAGEARNLTGTPDQAEWMPQFSPDGERVVFLIMPVGFRPGEGKLDYGDVRIAVVDRQGRRLFETEGINPHWMPAW